MSTHSQPEEDDIFKDILTDVKQNITLKPIPSSRPKVDDFEEKLKRENLELEQQLNDDLVFKDSGDFSYTKPNPKNVSTEEENIDDVLLDLELGTGGSKANSISKETKKEKDLEALKKRKQLLFSGGAKEDKDPVEIPKPKSLLDKSKREELNKESRDIQEVKKVGDIKEQRERDQLQLKDKVKQSFDFERDEQVDDFELPTQHTQHTHKAPVRDERAELLANEELRVLKDQNHNLQKRIEQMNREREENLKFESERQRKEIERLNLIHKQEVENMRSN